MKISRLSPSALFVVAMAALPALSFAQATDPATAAVTAINASASSAGEIITAFIAFAVAVVGGMLLYRLIKKG